MRISLLYPIFTAIFFAVSIAFSALSVNVSQSHQSIGRYQVLEIDFAHSGTYQDPITDVVIKVDFFHTSGAG